MGWTPIMAAKNFWDLSCLTWVSKHWALHASMTKRPVILHQNNCPNFGKFKFADVMCVDWLFENFVKLYEQGGDKKPQDHQLQSIFHTYNAG